MSRNPNYTILALNPDHVRIRDVGPWDKHLTVTNGAEHVVLELHKQGKLPPGTLLTCIDSEGDEDILRHDGAGNFLGFGPLPKANHAS